MCNFLICCIEYETLTLGLCPFLQYVEKRFVQRLKVDSRGPTVSRRIWDAVQMNKQQLALRLLITADANPNTTLEQAMGAGESSRLPLVATIATALSRRNSGSQHGRSNWSGPLVGNHSMQSAVELRSASSSPGPRAPTSSPAANEQPGTSLKDTRGCTLLHVACQIGDLSLIELLLQHRAQVSVTDAQGRTPLHYCILSGKNLCAKLLLTRYLWKFIQLCIGYYWNSQPLFSVILNLHLPFPVLGNSRG
jgi:Arf-GAP/coiled-coil/ANK repeat/PH domain-containing protein